jgi:hypothetical protein
VWNSSSVGKVDRAWRDEYIKLDLMRGLGKKPCLS